VPIHSHPYETTVHVITNYLSAKIDISRLETLISFAFNMFVISVKWNIFRHHYDFQTTSKYLWLFADRNHKLYQLVENLNISVTFYSLHITQVKIQREKC